MSKHKSNKFYWFLVFYPITTIFISLKFKTKKIYCCIKKHFMIKEMGLYCVKLNELKNLLHIVFMIGGKMI